MALERLQKILARAGVASRRACEGLIAAGRVTVDGTVVSELGAKADPQSQDVRLDGHRLRPEPLQYWILNKPKGVVCTNEDPAGRPRPVDLIPDAGVRLFTVGRLDADSKGLLLLTNDGHLANRLAHPRYEVPKTYRATVAGPVTAKDVQRLLRGVHLAEGKTRRARVKVLKRGRSRSTLQITIREGRNRQIRRMLARLRHPVRDLVRTRIGRLSLRGLGPGKARRLTRQEVEYLKELPEHAASDQGPRKKRRGAGWRNGAPAPKRDTAPPKGARRRAGRNTKHRRTTTHDSVGTSKSGHDHRGHQARGGRRGGGRRDRSRPRGRGTHRDSRQ